MLSVLINVKNGARHLEKCLDALHKFDDVVLLDNYSTDNTIAIAKRYPNVRIFTHEFGGMGRMRNLLATYAKYDWVFFVDSDEIVSSDLVDKLLHMQLQDGYVYSVLRHNFYANCLLDAASWGNDWVNRIYNRKQTSYSDAEVHESVKTQGLLVERINQGQIYHFPYENIRQLLDKLQFYSTLYAEQNCSKKVAKLYQIPFRTWFMFIKCYILKRGFRHGFEGFVVSVFNAMGVAVKYLKLYELQHKRVLGMVVTLPQNSTEVQKLIKMINAQVLLPHKVFFLTVAHGDTSVIPGSTRDPHVEIPKHEALADFMNEITTIINTNLVVPAALVPTIADIQKNANQIPLDNLVYVENNASLADKRFFKRCKNSIKM